MTNIPKQTIQYSICDLVVAIDLFLALSERKRNRYENAVCKGSLYECNNANSDCLL